MATTPGPSTTFQRRLQRDGLQTPWGFRLQGGKDFNQPLTVQRVFTGSPAEGELQRGDVVIAINNRDTNTITHKEALEIIKRSGGELVLSVQRGPSRYQAPNQPTTPQGFRPVQFSSSGPVPASPTKTASYGVHYGPPQARNEPMINRVQQSLENVTIGGQDQDDYDYVPVSQRKAVFQQAGGGGPRRPPQSRGRKWQPPSSQGGMQFGWGPQVRPDPNYRPGPPEQEGVTDFTAPQVQYKPVRQVGPAHPKPVTRPVSAGSYGEVDDHTPPAWKGSLKKIGTSGPSGPSYKSVNFSPHSVAAAQQPIRVQQPQGAAVNQGPQVVHLQYNSPLQMYSRGSAEDALHGQTAGRPGQGSMIITGGDGKQEIDWNKSHVYQMIHGQQKTGPQAARYVDQPEGEEIQYQGYQDHSRQSRSFQMLANQVEGADASDF